MKIRSNLLTDQQVRAIHRNELYPVQQCFVLGVLMLALLCLALTGCGKPAEASAIKAGGIKPKQFTDGFRTALLADRTVYATHVVTNPKKQHSPATADEYWQDSEIAIPLPAQPFRMGAERVSADASACFNHSLRSKWSLNEPHQPKSEFEANALDFLRENPGESFYGEEELGRKHVTYGVPNERYSTVARAFLWTLGQGLADDLTDANQEAWTQTYITMSTVMLDAANEAEEAA